MSARARLLAAALVVWVASRVLLARALELGYGLRLEVAGDVARYEGWSRLIAAGHLPTGDETWQYPPGAAAVMALPRLLARPLGYRQAFVLESLLADAVVVAVLAVAAWRSGRTAGLWAWVLGIAALGPFVLHRFDLVPAALAVAGIAAAARPVLAGLLLTAGGLVKVWPATLLPAVLATWRRLPRLAAGALAAVVVGGLALAATGLLADATDFLRQQRDRGLELESVAATPWLLQHAADPARAAPVLRYGAFEVLAPGVPTVVTVCTLLGLLVAAAAVVAAVRGRPCDRSDTVPLAVATVLGLMVTARVLSAQYLVWPLGIAALGLCQPVLADRARRWLAVTAGLLVVGCALTQWEFPLRFNELLAGEANPAVVLAVRNGLLVIATGAAVAATRAQRRAARPQPRISSTATDSSGASPGLSRPAVSRSTTA